MEDREANTMSIKNTNSTDSGASSRRDLQLVVEVEYPDSCPLSAAEERICDLVVRRNEERCAIDFLIESATASRNREVRHLASAAGGPKVCICDRFEQHDCLPHYTDVQDGSIVVTTYPPSREAASSLLSDLERHCNEIRLLRLRESNGDVGDYTTVDLSKLTPKQHEAMEAAYEAGFFERGSDTTLAELATELGISAAAFSQRLTRAKSELFAQMFDDP
jgi:predicted DNA binding protein